MVVLGEEAPKLLKCIPIDSTSFGSYSPYQNFLISSTSRGGELVKLRKLVLYGIFLTRLLSLRYRNSELGQVLR